MEFNIDDEHWVRIKQHGPWAVFAVTGPHWIVSRFNVNQLIDDHIILPGVRFDTLTKALASMKEHAIPKPKMSNNLFHCPNRFKL